MTERFMSRDACRILAEKIFGLARGGGDTWIAVNSSWTGDLRWARNDIQTGGDTEQSDITITRSIREAWASVRTNNLSDMSLQKQVKRAETLLTFYPEDPDTFPDRSSVLPHLEPHLWFDTTYALDEASRAQVAEYAIALAEQEKLLSAGYLQIAGRGQAILRQSETTGGLTRYYPSTAAQYSLTVRDPEHSGSGWAGMDHNDWTRIDTEELSRTALEKCLRSRNPVAIEPGRYTVVLEPQAVCDLVAPLLNALDRVSAEQGNGPFADREHPGYSRIGQQVMDTRLILSADPMDADCGFIPFDSAGEPYRHVDWIENGVLKELAYRREYAVRRLGRDQGLSNSRAFRLSTCGDGATDGGRTTSITDMIANTRRGLLVTRFDHVDLLDLGSMLLSGITRDGIWLIEQGTISKPVKNLRFTESPLFVLNNLEAIGEVKRVFRQEAPAVVPALMARDFSFTGLVDAV